MVRAHVRPMTEQDCNAVLAAFQEGLAGGHASFESLPPDWEGFDARFRPDCRLVLEEAGSVLGWAALSSVSSRPVYSGVCEISIYISHKAQGRGLGKYLLNALIAAAEEAGIWTLQATIFPENEASIALHKSCGFRQVGRREKIGLMRTGPLAGTWRDTVLLERRSKQQGTSSN